MLARTIGLLVLLIALPLAAGARTVARLVPQVSAGGGWASDLFVGAGFGSHGHGAVAPALAADLSTGPTLKLFSRYGATFARYGTTSGSTGHDAELTARLRLAPRLDLELGTSASLLDLDDPLPAEPDLPASVGVRVLEGGPLLRFRPDERSRVEAGTSLGLRVVELPGEASLDERLVGLFVAAGRRLGARVEAGLRLEHEDVAASGALAAGLDRRSTGVVASAAVAPWGELLARTSAGIEHVRFGAGTRREDLRLTARAGASHPLGEHVELEASLSWARGVSADPLGEGTRVSSWLGVRAELPVWL